MATYDLTPQQQAVVDDRGGALLVSAAAGSGKTMVLVERVLKRVTQEQANLDDFLLITFTQAAAAELRGKLVERLSRELAVRPGDRLLLLAEGPSRQRHRHLLAGVRRAPHRNRTIALQHDAVRERHPQLNLRLDGEQRGHCGGRKHQLLHFSSFPFFSPTYTMSSTQANLDEQKIKDGATAPNPPRGSVP